MGPLLCIVAEPLSGNIEAEVVGLEREDKVNKIMNVGGGRRKVTAKYFGDFEGYFFGTEYFMW